MLAVASHETALEGPAEFRLLLRETLRCCQAAVSDMGLGLEWVFLATRSK